MQRVVFASFFWVNIKLRVKWEIKNIKYFKKILAYLFIICYTYASKDKFISLLEV